MVIRIRITARADPLNDEVLDLAIEYITEAVRRSLPGLRSVDGKEIVVVIDRLDEIGDKAGGGEHA